MSLIQFSRVLIPIFIFSSENSDISIAIAAFFHFYPILPNSF